MIRETRKLKLSDDIIPEIGKHLEEGNVALLPSSNTYGFFANALNERAVKEIYRLKGRGAEKPLGLYINKERAPIYGETLAAEKILGLWPCPITIIVPKLKTVPDYITRGFNSVLMVCPDELCSKLNEYVDFPITCTSANRSGEASISDFESACENFDGHASMIVDGGRSTHGANGTIINFESAPPTVMRIGPYPVEELRKLVPDMVVGEKMI
jgi:tRNA threonylcarbamoyl adenosine modification protein (Sua5/YciO/YrdC/YwlC family)